MKKKKMALQWSGVFIELCLGRITRAQKALIDIHCPDLEKNSQAQWYDNTSFLNTHFQVDNWWSIDDLDRAMGLIFTDRNDLEKQLAAMVVIIDDTPASINPEAPQLSFYAPETMAPVDKDEQVICHGTRREALLQLKAEFEPPFDPSLITLSFLQYPDYGTILIDLDYNGHDDVQFTLGETTYLKPRFLGKEDIDDTSG